MQEDGAWANGRAEREEGTLYFRINTALAPVRDSGTHPYEARFAVSFGDSNDIDAELAKLNAVEDQLKERLEVDGKSHLGLVLTGAGFRDFFFYSRDPDGVISFFEGTLRENTEATVELTIRTNNWAHFRHFYTPFEDQG